MKPRPRGYIIGIGMKKKNKKKMNNSGSVPPPVSGQPGPPQERRLKRRDFLIALAILAAVIWQGLFTMHEIGISWDEPYYFTKAKGDIAWFVNMGKGGAFDQDTLRHTFGFHPKYDTHPTLFKLIGGVFYFLFRNQMAGFWAYRLSAVTMFALLLSLIYLRTGRWRGTAAGLGAVLCLAFMPRVFVDGHIAATETPLCLFWFLSVLAFESAGTRRSMIPLAGIAYGLLMSVKFTGFLLPIPLIAWAIIYRRKNLAFLSVSLLVLGPLIFWLLQPEMWRYPEAGFREFLRISIKRGDISPVWVLFLGKLYLKAPWYYAPFMTLVTVPVVTLVLFFIGTVKALAGRFKDSFAALCLINFLFFIAITFPRKAPVYDGVRLFLPAFIFLAIIAGYGFAETIRWLAAKVKASVFLRSVFGGGRWAGALAGLILAAGVCLPLIRVYPFGLEYYNELIGGVSGAREAGMETTYWWTVLNEDSMASVSKELPANATIRFYPMRDTLWKLYQELGFLRTDIMVTEGYDFNYILILSRPYWDSPGFYRTLKVTPSQLTILDSQKLDGVPLWIFYKRE